MSFYPKEESKNDTGCMEESVEKLEFAVIGRKIVSACEVGDDFILTLDTGKKVKLVGESDCCAYTYLDSFWIDPSSVDHMILGVGTTEDYNVWHIFADFGDIMRLNVGWSEGSGYYTYGFAISVED